MQTDKIKISKIRPNTGQIDGLPQNPRLLKDDRFHKLVKSIQDDPEMLDLRELIVVPKDGIYVVIAGNMRLRAMQELKMKEAPCKVLPVDTAIEKLRAYTIKDNVPFGEHDWSALANEWDGVELADWGLDLPIPTNFDVDDFFKDGGSDGGKEAGPHSIVLNYTEEEFHKVIARLGELGGSREQAIYKALGL